MTGPCAARIFFLCITAASCACSSPTENDADTDSEADIDADGNGNRDADTDILGTDGDSDGDADGDSDGDADGDSDGDADSDFDVNSCHADADSNGTVIAEDTFESGDLDGGAGWQGGWYTEYDVVVTGDGDPPFGEYHLRMRGRPNPGYLTRDVNLSGLSGVHLRFWAWLDASEPTSSVSVFIHFRVDDWYEVGVIEPTEGYRCYDFDLSAVPMASNGGPGFWYRTDSWGYFYLDDLEFVVP